MLVFLTDGESNVPDRLTPRQAAQLAANLSIPIYAIDASPESANDAKPEEIEERRKRAMMQTIAKMTEGHYFALRMPMASCARTRASIAGADRILSFQYRRYHEGFVWFALAALACWIALIVLESTWWRKLP